MLLDIYRKKIPTPRMDYILEGVQKLLQFLWLLQSKDLVLVFPTKGPIVAIRKPQVASMSVQVIANNIDNLLHILQVIS